MPGRIKAGEGALIGNAGEYYVVAELLKRGIIAALAPRNSPAFDILATNSERTVRIRVKTKSSEYSDWQWNAKKDDSIFRDLSNTDDFTVLVDLSKETKDLEFYIVPTHIINEWLVKDFNIWLSTPGKNNRPHSPENKKRHLKKSKFINELQLYLMNWNILWK